MAHSPRIERLIEALRCLPGIGPKSAQRLAFFVLKQSPEEDDRFAEALVDARRRIGHCQQCFNLSAQAVCEICAQHNRKREQICVVSEPQDLFALERTGDYRGLYHVLLGLISPLEHVGPENLKIQELVSRLANGGVEEVILALPPSIEGDTTSLYLTRLLKPLGVAISRIAFGLPAGGDLEYADNMTISRALTGRQQV